MAEIIQKDGTWAFDGDTLRLTPGRDRGVSLLRRTLGELTVRWARWRAYRSSRAGSRGG